ncbi:NAD-dependent epimerase/dehydratase family protein [Xanthomonas hortorum]|uniref:NAD-dependent epimerase/dehydratase family protein n=1 Tax=Xanthomonas hortorum TaxID=56454 RepID=UPI0029362404|nr:SDR family NAD(P)-dependent oxidoreductase [Xanthomonas hortorum]MDV2449660.1 SDR family NAD(P)-dependent oxidoreductase [Xanthomonas hortorum NBC5720]
MEYKLSTTCLITGGAGFIGCAISHALVQKFGRVVALDNLHPQVHPTQSRPDALASRVELVVGDVTDPAAWDALLQDVAPDLVIHLAAETGTGQSLTEGTRHANVNVVGTTQMLDAFVRHKRIPSRIVLTSSRAVYGEGAWVATDGTISYPGQRSKAQLDAATWDFPGLRCLPFEAERTETRPTSIYGSTKLAQEMILNAWALSFGVEVGLLRLQNVYGPGQSLSNPYTGIVSLFSRMAKAKKVIPLYEDGEIIRDFVFIEDVARAIVAVSLKSSVSPTAYDIGSGQATSIRELARLIARIYDAPEPVVNGAFRNGDVRAASCDIERATRELDWRPEWPVERGVAALCTWIDQQALPPL